MKKLLIGIVSILLLAIIVLPFITGDAEVDELNDKTRSQLEGKFIQLSDGVVHYELTGQPDSQVVVLVHGNAAPYFSWDYNVPALLQAGFRVLRYDIYGHGFSDRPKMEKYNWDFYDRQLVELIDSLKIKQPVDVAGTSQGGAIAVYFTAHHPERVRKLILCAPLFDEVTGENIMKFIRLPVIGEYFIKVMGDKMNLKNPENVFANTERLEEFREKFKKTMRFKGLKRARLANLRADEFKDYAAINTKLYKKVGQQDRPVLLIWGSADKPIPKGSIQRLRKIIPSIEYHEIEGAGHVAHYERSEEVNPILVEFLKQ